MRSSALGIIAAMAATILVVIPGGTAILCYQCNSKKDPGCAVLALPLAPANSTARYLNECDDGPDGEPAFCRRSIIKVLAAAEGKGEERVVRACGWVKHKNECYQFDDDDHHELVCQCFYDACNGARGLGGGAPVAAALALAALALLQGQR